MKLELKHLSPYLPYALPMMKGLHIGYLQCVKQPTENSLRNYFEFMVTSSGYWENSIEDTNPYKPILRPLSDLTKDIEVNSEKIKVHELLEIDSCSIEFINFENNSFFHNQPVIRTSDCEFVYAIDVYNNIIQELFKYHFDVFGLINKGLAIDINTLSE